MLFKDIIGQQDIKVQLRESVQSNRIAHAQLFYGPSGVGKLQLAIAYAQYLLCQNRTSYDACGICQSCQLMSKFQHPDLHFIFPIFKENSSKNSFCDDFLERFRKCISEKVYFSFNDWFDFIEAVNKQGCIYESESTVILHKATLKSFTGGLKIFIIWLPEKMNAACSNKILKILEEPPIQTLFILVSEDTTKILPTIKSRTQHIYVPRIDRNSMINSLLSMSSQNLSIQEASLIFHLSNGSWLKALKILNADSDRFFLLEKFVSLFKNAWLVGNKRESRSLLELRNWSVGISALNREKQKFFLEYSQQQIRELFIRSFNKDELNYQTKKEIEETLEMITFIKESNINKIIDSLNLAQKQIEQNGNSKIIFFDLCLQMIIMLKN